MDNVTVYTLPTCPRCAVLKKKLTDKGISFSECQDEETMLGKGIESCPMLEVDGRMLTFAEANQWVNERN